MIEAQMDEGTNHGNRLGFLILTKAWWLRTYLPTSSCFDYDNLGAPRPSIVRQLVTGRCFGQLALVARQTARPLKDALCFVSSG